MNWKKTRRIGRWTGHQYPSNYWLHSKFPSKTLVFGRKTAQPRGFHFGVRTHCGSPHLPQRRADGDGSGRLWYCVARLRTSSSTPLTGVFQIVEHLAETLGAAIIGSGTGFLELVGKPYQQHQLVLIGLGALLLQGSQVVLNPWPGSGRILRKSSVT